MLISYNCGLHMSEAQLLRSNNRRCKGVITAGCSATTCGCKGIRTAVIRNDHCGGRFFSLRRVGFRGAFLTVFLHIPWRYAEANGIYASGQIIFFLTLILRYHCRAQKSHIGKYIAL